MGRRTRWVGVVAALLLFAGCADAEPAAKAPAVSVESTSPAVAPEAETAEEFIRRWFAVQHELQRTGDATAYLELSSDCAACRNSAEFIEGIYRNGGHVDFGGEEIRSIKRRWPESPVYDVKVNTGVTSYRESVGKAEQRIGGGPEHYVLHVKRTEAGWEVAELLQGTS